MTTRPYKVSALGGGRKSFANLDNAVAFAATQANASWAQEDWSVWDTSQVNEFDPTWKLGTCVRMVAADGTAWDPNAPVTYVDLSKEVG